MKERKEALAATNTGEIKQLRRDQMMSTTRAHRQMECGNYENRGLRDGETDDSLCIGRAMQPQDAINIVGLIWGD